MALIGCLLAIALQSAGTCLARLDLGVDCSHLTFTIAPAPVSLDVANLYNTVVEWSIRCTLSAASRAVMESTLFRWRNYTAVQYFFSGVRPSASPAASAMPSIPQSAFAV